MPYNRQDIFHRLKVLLPPRWFGEETPVLDTVLNALAVGWLNVHELLDFVRLQTRVRTSFGPWLDLTAQDYFGHRLKRRRLESDRSFVRRIINELNRDKCTRAALHDILLFLTGRPPLIFEPANPCDAGCYGLSATGGHGTAGYGVAGGWGSLDLPFQVFVRVRRPLTEGVAMINGWGETAGGLGAGQSSYITLETTASSLTDEELYAHIHDTAPAGCRIWVSIES